MAAATEQLQTITLRQSAKPITGATADYDPLMDVIGDSRLVLMGMGNGRTAGDVSDGYLECK